MKQRTLITIIILFCLPFVLQAQGARKVTVKMKDRPVYELLEVLKKEGRLTIVYSKEMLTKDGKPITINIELTRRDADLVLEVVSRAAGFTFEEKKGIIIILPVVKAPHILSTTVSTSSKSAAADKEEIKEDPKQKSGFIQLMEEGKPKKQFSQKRYVGNFMFGHGDKIYLNLEIPMSNSSEAKRITRLMRKYLEDNVFSTNEAETLFGRGSKIGGKEIDRFLKILAGNIRDNIKDGSLSSTEINQLRNDFINNVVNTYEEF